LKTYEGMFLLESDQPNFEEAVEPIRSILQRSEAEVLQLRKWDERKLIYEIKGRRRGLYVLTYFKADPSKIVELERNAQLNERILRVLILSADHVTAEQMSAATPAEYEPAHRDYHQPVQDKATSVEMPAEPGAVQDKATSAETPAEHGAVQDKPIEAEAAEFDQAKPDLLNDSDIEDAEIKELDDATEEKTDE